MTTSLINCYTANITIKKLLEGNSVIQCGTLNGKMINGSNVDIDAKQVSIEAVYGEQTRILSKDDISVGLSRGDIQVHLIKRLVCYLPLNQQCLTYVKSTTPYVFETFPLFIICIT